MDDGRLTRNTVVRLFVCGRRRAFIPSLVHPVSFDWNATVNATVARITKPNWSSSRSVANPQAHGNFSAQSGWFSRPKSQPYCICRSLTSTGIHHVAHGGYNVIAITTASPQPVTVFWFLFMALSRSKSCISGAAGNWPEFHGSTTGTHREMGRDRDSLAYFPPNPTNRQPDPE